jgi:hypothetical protein
VGKIELGMINLLRIRHRGHVFDVLFRFPSSRENGDNGLAALSFLFPDDLQERIQPAAPNQQP